MACAPILERLAPFVQRPAHEALGKCRAVNFLLPFRLRRATCVNFADRPHDAIKTGEVGTPWAWFVPIAHSCSRQNLARLQPAASGAWKTIWPFVDHLLKFVACNYCSIVNYCSIRQTTCRLPEQLGGAVNFYFYDGQFGRCHSGVDLRD